jgi:hypothetical protein
MATHFGNGSVRFKNRTLPIVWAGQYAQHVAENYIDKKPNHTLLHVEIQQALQHSKHFSQVGKLTYCAFSENNKGTILVFFVKRSTFVEITSGYVLKISAEKAINTKGGRYE